MGDMPLSLDRFMWRAEHLHPTREIVVAVDGGVERTTYGDWLDDTDRVGPLLDLLGVSADGRIGTVCWSHIEHMQLFFGVPVAGRVLHPVNVRLSDDQFAYVVNVAEDEVVVADASLVPQLARVLGSTPSVRHVLVVRDGDEPLPDLPGVEVHDYRQALASVAPCRTAVTDEWQAAVMTNTTGSVGNPKSVVHSHRSLVMHTLSTLMTMGAGIDDADVLLPMVPFFHANSLTFPHAGVATGATLVLPGSDYSGAALAGLMESQRVTCTVGVPTHYTMTLPHLVGRDLSALRANLCGSAAVPPTLSHSYGEVTGVPLSQGWGMSEAGPMATLPHSSVMRAGDDDAIVEMRHTAGTPLPGIELRLIDAEGTEVPWDGVSGGELHVRGHSVANGYYGGDGADAVSEDGWLKTGDVATIDADGRVRIIDRIKDVIKSGGEWISSIALELAALEHPAVSDAAAVGVPHPKWGERPALFVVSDRPVDAEEMTTFLAERLERWWLPDVVVPVDVVPRNANSKIDKRALRQLAPELSDS